jgi:hypothetical protein
MNLTTNIQYYPEWIAYLKSNSRTRSSCGGEMIFLSCRRPRNS